MKAIASDNGMEAVKKAYAMMAQGADPLDAAVAGVNLVEDDPEETSVGYGGLPNEEGIVELDAAVMHGPSGRSGAVAALRDIRHAAKVAQLVMEQTDHIMLVGEGARKFAIAQGFQPENLLTEKARQLWLHWKRTLSANDDWLAPDDRSMDAALGRWSHRPQGTIHLSALSSQHELSCVTTTSGRSFKITGRVGDSCILGAGLYLDNSVGTCGGTGRGEAAMDSLCSFLAVELMRGGMAPVDAGLAALKRVADRTVPRLRFKDGRPVFDLKLYLLSKDGRHAGVSLWGPAQFAVMDQAGCRHEPCALLFDGPKPAA